MCLDGAWWRVRVETLYGLWLETGVGVGFKMDGHDGGGDITMVGVGSRWSVSCPDIKWCQGLFFTRLKQRRL